MVGVAEQTAQIGQRLGRYELLARIARGGMAEVYVARVRGEGGFEKLVAVKIMLPSFAEDPRFVEMFLDEGRIAGHIESPHVVQVLDVGRAADGTLFIVMDLVRGVPLNRLVAVVGRARKRLPVAVSVAIIAQAAEGLAAAHDAATPLGEKLGVVHRDVSPQNILIGADGRVRVVDFGIARALLRRATTSTGELKGKFGYFAPEQLMGKQADSRSDIFALGVVAWESLTSRRLFHSENPLEALEKIRSTIPERLDMVRKDVSSELATAVDQALRRDPAGRYAHASDFATDLRNAVKTTLADQGQIGAFIRKYCMEDLQGLEDKIRRALVADTRQGPIDESDHGEPIQQKPASGVIPFLDGKRGGSLRSRVPSHGEMAAFENSKPGFTSVGNPSSPSIVLSSRDVFQEPSPPRAGPPRSERDLPPSSRTTDAPEPPREHPLFDDSSQEATHVRPLNEVGADPSNPDRALPKVPQNLQARAYTTPVKAPPPPTSQKYESLENQSRRFALPERHEQMPLGAVGNNPWDAPPPARRFPFAKVLLALMLTAVGALATYAYLLNQGRDQFAQPRPPRPSVQPPTIDVTTPTTTPTTPLAPDVVPAATTQQGVDASVVLVPVETPVVVPPTATEIPSVVTPPDATQSAQPQGNRRRRVVRRRPDTETTAESPESGFFALPDTQEPESEPEPEPARPQRVESSDETAE